MTENMTVWARSQEKYKLKSTDIWGEGWRGKTEIKIRIALVK